MKIFRAEEKKLIGKRNKLCSHLSTKSHLIKQQEIILYWRILPKEVTVTFDTTLKFQGDFRGVFFFFFLSVRVNRA